MSMMRVALVGCRTGASHQLSSKLSSARPSTSLSVLRQHQDQYHRRSGLSASQLLHTHVGCNNSWDDRRKKEQEEKRAAQLQLSSLSRLPGQVAHYHATPRSESNAVALILGLGTVSALAYAGSSAMKAYEEYKASLPSEEELEEMRKQEEEEAKAREEEAQANAKEEEQQQPKSEDGKRENIFNKWFGVGVGAKYYEGGFEETMTRREAALILGVRESSPPSRIKLAHRKLLVLNHPDTGGSTYVSGKINEAKELLLKGKRQRDEKAD